MPVTLRRVPFGTIAGFDISIDGDEAVEGDADVQLPPWPARRKVSIALQLSQRVKQQLAAQTAPGHRPCTCRSKTDSQA